MDYSFLRTAAATDLALNLRADAHRRGTDAVTRDLLAGIESGSLPPRVFTTWSTASGDPKVVTAGLQQTFSRLVCRSAIKRFGRWLLGPRLQDAWTAVGGTQGILQFLARASVQHVKLFCRIIGRAASAIYEKDLRQEYAQEFFMALNPVLFPDTALRTTDQRPLRQHYLAILPACSVKFIEDVCKRGDDRLEDEARIVSLPVHLATYREQSLQQIYKNEGSLDDLISLARVDAVIRTERTAGYRITVNMQFAIQVLEILSVQDVLPKTINHSTIASDVVVPLFSKLCRLRSPSATCVRVIQIFSEYHRRHVPLHQSMVDLEEKGIIWYTVRMWARSPNTLTQSLETVLRLATKSSANVLVRILQLAVPTLRYRLLRMIILHLPEYKVDIDVDEQLKDFTWGWNPQIFLDLPKSEGRQLLERIIALRPAANYNEWGITPYFRKLQPQHKGDPTTLLLYLSNQDSDIIERAAAVIEERKKKAVAARQQADRSLWARCACDCALATGSLDLYRDTLLWASERFARDPLTCRDIHSDGALHIREGIQLLRGFPGTKQELRRVQISVEEIRRRLHIGNTLCEKLFLAACNALEEPSFAQHHWDPVLRLFGTVVYSRISHVDNLQDALGLSDDAVYDTIWKDTLEMCLKLETAGLQDDLRRLEFRTVGGPLLRAQRDPQASALRPATAKFIDELARRRDDLWTQYRRREVPEVLSLGQPWPKGLPFAMLLALKLRKPQEDLQAPFLRSRAEQVVFVDEKSALSPLPQSEESKRAIGVFIEDWKVAMEFYVYTAKDTEEAALRVWEYATTTLSAARMSSTESIIFWTREFKEVLRSLPIAGPWSDQYQEQAPLPSLPKVEDLSYPTEWDPRSDSRNFEIKSRVLDFTCLDAMLPWSLFSGSDITSDMATQYKPVVERTAPPFWSNCTRERISPGAQEAAIAAALLTFAEVNKVSPGILQKPFPSGEGDSCRFPSLFLASEFLEEFKDDYSVQARMMLRKFCDNVPPKLLLRLVKDMVPVYDDSKSEGKPSVSRDVFLLLKLLSRCDDPEVGLELVRWVIIERPMDSSWHRHILNSGLLLSLPAEAVRKLAVDLVASIKTKLANGSQGREVRNRGSTPGKAAVVKVTTVKLLAQLLSETEFIDEVTTVNILTSLLVGASHLDSRVAAIESLGQILTSPSSPVTKRAVLQVLEDQVLPMISNINERRLVTEEEWAAAEASPEGQLPEVYLEEPSALALPPILSSIDRISRSDNTDDATKAELYSRILLPALEASVHSNRRWLKLFARHYDFPEVVIPDLPVYPRMLLQLINNEPELVPARLMNMWYDLWKLRIQPSEQIKAIQQHFRSDSKLLSSNAALHFLALTSQENLSDLQPLTTPIGLLTQNVTSKIPDGISIEFIENLALRQANDAIMLTSKPSQTYWDTFVVSKLAPPRHSDHPRVIEKLDTWTKQCKPFIQTLINTITSLRTSEWQHAHTTHRHPQILPSTFPLRLWLAVKSDNMPQGVSTLLDELGNSPRLYAAHFSSLQNFLLDQLPDSAKFELILHLSRQVKLDSEEAEEHQTADYLRIELVAEMIRRIRNVEAGDQRAAVKAQIDAWIASPDEDIRMTGLKLRDVTVGNDGTKPWYC